MKAKIRTTDLSWKQLERLVRKLASKIRESGWKPQCLIGITVGGIIPLALLADEFGTKNIATVSARSYSKKRQGKLRITSLPEIDLRGKRVLLVDEIADRGTSLKRISGIFMRRYKVRELRTAALVVNKKKCKHWPDYHVLETDKWIVFPWDNEHS